MKTLAEVIERKEVVKSTARNDKEDLVNQIVALTTEKDTKHFAKILMIGANKRKYSLTKLHTLLRKKHDPSIENYTAFVKWYLLKRKI